LDKVYKEVVDSLVDFSFGDEGGGEEEEGSNTETDRVTEYGKQLMRLGGFYLEFSEREMGNASYGVGVIS